jgi:hypothetical protein
LSRGQEKVSDLRRSGTQIHEAHRDLGPDRWAQSRGNLRRQPGRDGRVRESVHARLGADRSGAKCLVQQLISGRVTGGCRKVEPVETISDLRYPPENLDHPGGQIGSRVLINRCGITSAEVEDLEARPRPGA